MPSPGFHEEACSQHELAEFELNDAADYYNSKQVGLGRSFILEVRQAVLQLLSIQSPQR